MRHIYFMNYYKIFVVKGGDLVDKNEFFKELQKINVYEQQEEYNKLLESLKHNICQNMRIARKLSKIEPDQAAELLKLELQSLRRIEAENDRDEFSTRVLIMAIMIYKPDANFYFKKWQENELLLKEKNHDF